MFTKRYFIGHFWNLLVNIQGHKSRLEKDFIKYKKQRNEENTIVIKPVDKLTTFQSFQRTLMFPNMLILHRNSQKVKKEFVLHLYTPVISTSTNTSLVFTLQHHFNSHYYTTSFVSEYLLSHPIEGFHLLLSCVSGYYECVGRFPLFLSSSKCLSILATPWQDTFKRELEPPCHLPLRNHIPFLHPSIGISWCRLWTVHKGWAEQLLLDSILCRFLPSARILKRLGLYISPSILVIIPQCLNWLPLQLDSPLCSTRSWLTYRSTPGPVAASRSLVLHQHISLVP